jgi:hypothetical protein
MPVDGLTLRVLANRQSYDRAISSADAWLTRRDLQQGKIPREMRLHS